MSKIIRVAHSFCRKSDNPNAMIDALCKRLLMTHEMIAATKAILTTKNGCACRAVDIERDHHVSISLITRTKNVLEYIGAIKRTEEFMVVNWSNIRRIIATPMNEPLVTHGALSEANNRALKTTCNIIRGETYTKHSRPHYRPGYVPKPKKAMAAPSISAESIQAMIKAEVHNQMLAMAKRMTSI